MDWLKRYTQLFKEEPESLDIDEALQNLRCIECNGPLSATLVQLTDQEEVWDFRCQDGHCDSQTQH